MHVAAPVGVFQIKGEFCFHVARGLPGGCATAEILPKSAEIAATHAAENALEKVAKIGSVKAAGEAAATTKAGKILAPIAGIGVLLVSLIRVAAKATTSSAGGSAATRKVLIPALADLVVNGTFLFIG